MVKLYKILEQCLKHSKCSARFFFFLYILLLLVLIVVLIITNEDLKPMERFNYFSKVIELLRTKAKI